MQTLMSVTWALIRVIRTVPTHLEVSFVTAQKAMYWEKMATHVMVRLNFVGYFSLS